MSEPTKDQIAAAVCTPIRDLRDEVWVRVYAQVYAESHRVDLATFHADKAVERMPIPAHRRAEVGLS